VFDLEGGLKFVMEKKLYTAAQPITVDVSYTGFQVNSSLQLGGGSSCSTSCGSAGGSCAC
jgi:hypothetical protein